jgi:hypothetical protein
VSEDDEPRGDEPEDGGGDEPEQESSRFVGTIYTRDDSCAAETAETFAGMARNVDEAAGRRAEREVKEDRLLELQLADAERAATELASTNDHLATQRRPGPDPAFH